MNLIVLIHYTLYHVYRFLVKKSNLDSKWILKVFRIYIEKLQNSDNS